MLISASCELTVLVSSMVMLICFVIVVLMTTAVADTIYCQLEGYLNGVCTAVSGESNACGTKEMQKRFMGVCGSGKAF